jgi:hypothetical protein
VGKKPEILELLPEQGLDETRVRYMHSFMALRHHYSLGWKDILNMDGKVDAVLGEYSDAADGTVLLVVKYPDEQSARKGAARYLEYTEERPGTRTYPTRTGEGEILSWKKSGDEDGPTEGGQRWSSVVRTGPLLVIVLEARQREGAERLTDAVLARWKRR